MDIHTIMVWSFIGIFCLVLTNIAFIHCMKNEFSSKKIKTVWSVISLIPFIGFIIYFIFGARKAKNKI